MILMVIKFVGGILLLNKAADWFSRGAALVAALTGLPRLLMGALLVAFITHLPELVIASAAAWTKHSEIALGTAIGANICNTGLILGLCLIRMRADVIEQAWLRDQGIPMLLVGILLYAFGMFGDITRGVAAILLLLCVCYVAWSVISAKREPALARQAENLADEALGDTAGSRHRWAVVITLLIISVPVVLVSSHWVLSSAVDMARIFGISESVIALSLVAGGTSLPELATALAASRKGHYDTSIGIILGSNILNTLGVLGVAGLCNRLPFTGANRLFDMPVMLLLMVIPLLPGLVGRVPGRMTGRVLLGIYVVYVYSLFTLYGIFD